MNFLYKGQKQKNSSLLCFVIWTVTVNIYWSNDHIYEETFFLIPFWMVRSTDQIRKTVVVETNITWWHLALPKILPHLLSWTPNLVLFAINWVQKQNLERFVDDVWSAKMSDISYFDLTDYKGVVTLNVGSFLYFVQIFMRIVVWVIQQDDSDVSECVSFALSTIFKQQTILEMHYTASWGHFSFSVVFVYFLTKDWYYDRRFPFLKTNINSMLSDCI